MTLERSVLLLALMLAGLYVLPRLLPRKPRLRRGLQVLCIMAATLDAARQMGYERIICVYQPHTYSRTKGLFDEFAAALGKADLPILCDIYAARETDTLGVSSELLAKATRGAVYMESFDRIADYLREHARAGDLILTMGAGDIAKLAGLLLGGK